MCIYKIYIYTYPLTNCSVETYVQSYWRGCLLLTRRLSSTHLHNQLWINNLRSPSGQIISLPKQLDFQKFVPIFFVVSWSFCQDRPCFFGSIIHRKKLAVNASNSLICQPLAITMWIPLCWSPTSATNHQPTINTNPPPKPAFLEIMYQGSKGWKQDLGGAPDGSLLGSCDTLGKSLLSKTCLFQIWRYVFLNFFAIWKKYKKLMSFGRCCLTFGADSHVLFK